MGGEGRGGGGSRNLVYAPVAKIAVWSTVDGQPIPALHAIHAHWETCQYQLTSGGGQDSHSTYLQGKLLIMTTNVLPLSQYYCMLLTVIVILAVKSKESAVLHIFFF